jgi:hypothetical protein
LEGGRDLLVGLGRQVGDHNLDALILGLEADEGFGAVEPHQGHHADPRARRKYGVGGGGGICRGNRQEGGREQASDQGHEDSTGFHAVF